jgi:predicted ATPase
VLLLHHMKTYSGGSDNGSTNLFASHSRTTQQDLTKNQEKRQARWFFEVEVVVSTVGVVRQRLETGGTKGARLRNWLVRSMVLHLEDTGVAQCFVAESSLMGSLYIVGVAEAAGKVLQVEQVEVLAALGENR